MTYSVKEIYYTLQGEGAHTGRPAVFLRFSGCNLWSGREMHREQAICRFCDTEFVGVESNGTIEAPDGIDWLCISPKGSASLEQIAGDELKLVYPQLEESAQPSEFEHLSFKHFFLQPLDSPDRDDNTRQAIEYCKQNPRWKLSVQTHKYLGLD